MAAAVDRPRRPLIQLRRLGLILRIVRLPTEWMATCCGDRHGMRARDRQLVIYSARRMTSEIAGIFMILPPT